MKLKGKVAVLTAAAVLIYLGYTYRDSQTGHFLRLAWGRSSQCTLTNAREQSSCTRRSGTASIIFLTNWRWSSETLPLNW